MCGIVGYIGRRQSKSIVLDCLKNLEYRGYDSCGVALADNNLMVFKEAVRVGELSKVFPDIDGRIGIGHTRWATHGEPSQINAHPHTDCSGRIAVVHNGIISNYLSLKKQLIKEGHTFVSDTDTEVISHLIEKYYKDNLEEAVLMALKELEGSYAIAVVSEGVSKLLVARKDSPLVLGIGDRENFIASDVPAILEYTNRVIYLEDGDLGILTPDSIQILQDGVEVAREEHRILWSAEQAKKGGYEHFMLKEIHEQPKVIRDTLTGWLSAMTDQTNNHTVTLNDVKSLLIIACGTSYHAALVGKVIIEELLGIQVNVELASEFNYYSRIVANGEVIAITQSGETADTLKAMKKLKEAGCKVIAITNVVGSTASRIADQVVYTQAGPEISVAATKTFVAQLMTLYWLVLSSSSVDDMCRNDSVLELRQLPQKAQQVLDSEDRIIEIAKYLSGFDNAFFIGRGINMPVVLEAALKLKEISYIHAEGYAAGELKHGPFALLSDNTPVVAIVTRDNTYEAILANIREVKARKAPVIALVEESDEAIGELADIVIGIPRVDSLFSPVINIVALQLLAYHTARERGCPIDFPRNLAKSVTVE